MRKFYFKQLLTTLLLLCSSAVSAANDMYIEGVVFRFEYNGIYYSVASFAEKTVAVTFKGSSHDEYIGEYSGIVNIPETVIYENETYRVTRIVNYTFSNCTGIKEITIPNSVTTVGENAFLNCTGITEITIPNSVTNIGHYAFNGCTALKKISFEDGESTLSLGCKSFSSYSSYLGQGLFYDCPLEVLYLGRNLSYNSHQNHGYSPFYGKTTLTDVTIGNNVTVIGECAFLDCTELIDIRIPNNVKTIENSAFANCTGITEITIPNSVTEIKYDVFNGCTALKDFTIEDGDCALFVGCKSGTIRDGLLYDCPLETLYLGRDLSHDYYSPFYNKTTLKNVTIGNRVTSIGNNAFYNCNSLTNIELPNSITKIGYGSFRYCSGLTGALIIPNSVITIGYDAFKNCTGLTSVYIGTNIANIGTNAFSNCNNIQEVHISNLESYCKIKCDNATSNPMYRANTLYLNGAIIRGTLTIPEDVTEIPPYAFKNCSGIRKVIIPDNVTSIGFAAFEKCENITDIQIGNGVTNIGEHAFSHCTNLTNIIIPDNVTNIGSYAFQNCQGVTSVKIGNSVTDIGIEAFLNCTKLVAVYINDLANWCRINFNEMNDRWGNSRPSNPLYYAKNLYLNEELITNLVIPDDITEIRSLAFHGCESLKSVKIHNNVKTIGYKAFYNCNNLLSAIIGNNVNNIGNYAFNNCKSLTNITIPNSVTTINEGAFYGCSGLTSVKIGNGVTTIGTWAFKNCTGELFINCDIPDLATNSSTWFYGSKFSTIIFGNKVKNIGKYAFYNNSNVQEVFFGGSVEVIGFNSFENCKRLKTVSIPSSVQYIDDYAFRGCDSITTVETLSSTPVEIYNDIFSDAIYNNATLFVPAGSKEAYQAADYWEKFTNIVEVSIKIPVDINSDGTVDVADVTKVVSMILDESQSSDTGDVNGDGIVDVADITKVISVILGSDTASEAPAKAAATRAGATSTVSAEIENNELFVNITNPTFAFSAIQFDIVLPEGIEVDFDGEYYAVDLGSRTNNRRHSYPECAIQPDGSLRVVIVSMSNALYNGTEGDVAVASLKVDGLTDGRYEYGIKNVTIANEKSQKEVLEAYTAELIVANGVTGIGSIDAEGTAADGAIYDLAGRKVDSTVKGGIYIQNGKKFVAE